MKILIVEDEDIKMKDIQRFVAELYPMAVIDTSTSYADAVKRCYSVLYDFLILDMNIPQYGRGDHDKTINSNGGEMIVRELYSEDIFIKFAFVSQYETVGEESIASFDQRMVTYSPQTYCGFVFFEANDDAWKQKLSNILHNNLIC